MKRFALFALLMCAVAWPLAAQTTTGSIDGRVVDENAAPLPGVTVEALSPNLMGTKTSVTDVEGHFRFNLLPPGTYSVKFTLSGFSTVEHNDVSVSLGRNVALAVEMRSAFKEEVVVSGAAPTVDVKSTEIGTNIDFKTFNNLPVGRNYTSVVNTTPGATTNDAAGTMVYGSTGSENAYYIDGVNTTGVELGQQGKTLNFEFIQEVQVKTGGYMAEFGRSTGGLINVITKSGGNEFHGDVFGYYDDDSLQDDPSDDVIRYREIAGGSATPRASPGRTSAPTSAASSSRTGCGSSPPTTASTTAPTRTSPRTSPPTAAPRWARSSRPTCRATCGPAS